MTIAQLRRVPCEHCGNVGTPIKRERDELECRECRGDITASVNRRFTYSLLRALGFRT